MASAGDQAKRVRSGALVTVGVGAAEGFATLVWALPLRWRFVEVLDGLWQRRRLTTTALVASSAASALSTSAVAEPELSPISLLVLLNFLHNERICMYVR